MINDIIGILAKLRDTTSELKGYVPDLTKAMDKIARSLIMLWIKNYELKDYFSMNEFNRVEDLLKDVFKSMGEIVLMFKKKFSPMEL